MNDKGMIAGIIMVSIVLLSGAYFIFTSTAPVKIDAYSKSASERPKVAVGKTDYNLGKMNVKDVKSKDFSIRNAGSKPLQLYGITSSCGCVTGQIIYKGESSREFGMHNSGNDSFVIVPKTEAVIRVTYRPSVMPVYGKVSREVYVSTNDPENARVIFRVNAFVE